MNAVRALKGVSRAAMHLLAVSMLIAVPGCDEDDKVPERTSGKMERPVCADMSGKDLKSCCDALDAKDPDRASCCERLDAENSEFKCEKIPGIDIPLPGVVGPFACEGMSGKDLKSCCDALDAKDPDRASCCERLEGQGMRCD